MLDKVINKAMDDVEREKMATKEELALAEAQLALMKATQQDLGRWSTVAVGKRRRDL